MANKRILLSDSEATLLGFELNKIQDGKKKARYMVSEEDSNKIDKLRESEDLKKKVLTMILITLANLQNN